MDEKKKVYVETSVISNLTARPSHDIFDLARQMVTHQWWETAAAAYHLYTSPLVEREAQRGDSSAASRRIAVLRDIESLAIPAEAETLAGKLLDAAAVPHTSYEDAVHIATAAVNGMDYLVTWNCRHIANAVTMPKIYEMCKMAGYKCPVICTPEQL